MEDYGAMIRNTFELGSVRDAEALFDACVENAFPTSHFRRLELIRFVKDEQYLEGRSWNHVFDIRKDKLNGSDVWKSTATGSPWARPRTRPCAWTT